MAVKVHINMCDMQGACLTACPMNVLDASPDGKVLIARPDDCIECGACVSACPKNALYL